MTHPQNRPRNRARGLAAADGGSALAEMAVIAPLLVLLLIGLIEVGRYAHYSILTANAARAGVQYGAQNLVTATDTAGMGTHALNDAGNIAGITASPSPAFCKCADGTTSTCLATDCGASHRIVYVQVDTTGVFTSMLHFPGLPASQTVKGRAIMRVSE